MIVKDELMLYALKLDINFLSNLLANCLATKKDAGLLVFANGEVAEHLGDEFYSHKRPQVNRQRPHLYFSLQYFLKEWIVDEQLSEFFLPSVLNENEKMVLKELRNKNIRKITIKKSDDQSIRIESTQRGIINGAQADEIKKILGLENYTKISLSTRDEKTLSFKKINKKTNSG